MDIDGGKYNLESLFTYWNNNTHSIENELRNQFNVFNLEKYKILLT